MWGTVGQDRKTEEGTLEQAREGPCQLPQHLIRCDIQAVPGHISWSLLLSLLP